MAESLAWPPVRRSLPARGLGCIPAHRDRTEALRGDLERLGRGGLGDGSDAVTVTERWRRPPAWSSLG